LGHCHPTLYFAAAMLAAHRSRIEDARALMRLCLKHEALMDERFRGCARAWFETIQEPQLSQFDAMQRNRGALS